MEISEKETKIHRVARMEVVFDQCNAAVAALLEAAEWYRAVEPALRELDDYYRSPLWMADFDGERKGEFPRDLKRGILTEDAIFDLLTDEVRMKKLLEQLLKENA